MLIDWFTVIAQAVNFLILVWLLKRFLYKPILRAIDEREKRIAAQLQQADARMAEAQKERDEFQRKNADFDQQRQGLVAKTDYEAKAERQRLLIEARKAADELSKKLRESMQIDELNLNRALARRAQTEVFAITRKALTDLASGSLEERMADVFIRRLRELNGEAKERIVSAIKASARPVIVRSTFELPSLQRIAIEKAVNETSSSETQVKFETAPELISGIELTVGGQKVAWSIADYLAALEKGVVDLLEENAKPLDTQTNPKPRAEENAGR
jgi:F-type H+-transporting ATPase subunit b